MGESDVRLQLRCDRCGPVEVSACDVEVHANRREDFMLYCFVCPSCADIAAGGCREQIRRLVAAGARQRELRSTSAPPLTHDDLLDFHQWLAGDPPWPTDDPSSG